MEIDPEFVAGIAEVLSVEGWKPLESCAAIAQKVAEYVVRMAGTSEPGPRSIPEEAALEDFSFSFPVNGALVKIAISTQGQSKDACQRK